MHASTSANRTPPTNPTIGVRAGSLLARLFFGLLLALAVSRAAKADVICNGGRTLPQTTSNNPEPLLVTGKCLVKSGTYFYGNVNIYTDPMVDEAPQLIFQDEK